MNRLKNFLHPLLRRVGLVLLLLCFWSAMGLPAMAKHREEAPAKVEKGYAKEYGLVILAVALGVLTVCRPGKRADKPKDKIRDEEL